MIDTILSIIKMLVAVLPFVFFCLINNKTNLDKPERSRQFVMPIFAVVYVIAAMLLMDWLCDWLLKLINAIPAWIASLANYSWMPTSVGDVLLNVSNWIANFLQGLNLVFWIFFVANTVIIVAYLLLKKIILGIVNKAVKFDGKAHMKIAPLFYRYFFERNFWCLKDSYAQVRTLLKVFYYSAVVISSVLMIVSSELFLKETLKTVFFPVFGVLIMGEMFFYLDGLTLKEQGTITGEDDNAYRVVNYSLLRKFLRNLFKDKLLAENTSLNSSLAYHTTTDDILRELEKDEDPKITSFAAYMKALNKTGHRIDHNYLYSALDMLRGKNILFNNPFYKDLIPYAFYPMNRTLLSHRKVMVVLGRHAIEDDVKDWIEQGIGAITNIPFMWDVQVLDKTAKNPDIGIVTRSSVLDTEIHQTNAEFFEQVGFVVILEPSKLITTAQIGLNLIIKRCRTQEDKDIVYCLCDKNCDGLVDAMSHILMANITEVSATNKHSGTSSYMCWETDKDYLHHRLVPNISRYLGLGTELSFAALKNQIAKTEWYGGEAFPVTDIRWIDQQYYYDLTKYAGLPTNQESMNEFFRTSANFWSAEVEPRNFITVEDESFNMFEILRTFSTRTSEQGFINVISPEYLLKDYMADNASIFATDAKAIPTIVADFTRSNRNTIMRLLLSMSVNPVSSTMLEHELSLLGIAVFDLKKQLWYEVYKCFASTADIARFAEMDYQTAVEEVASETLPGSHASIDIFCIEDAFNLKAGELETTYAIRDTAFIRACVTDLRSAGYVAEDESGSPQYLGAELSGHIYQKYLPGQFFTLGGKYYEMQHLTSDGQILVRRAADHIHGRPSYRQIRRYTLGSIQPSDRVGAVRDIAGIKVSREFADIRVDTPGYYRMDRYNDFATAKKVLFEGKGIATRSYRNKELLRIELPELDGQLNDRIRTTVTVLFNEIFKTLFAENQAFISAVTVCDAPDAQPPMTYSIVADGCELQKNAIYIIEDSQLDLGLTVAVERNLQRIFEIMHDYLDWHRITLETSLIPPPPPPAPVTFGEDDPNAGPKKRGFMGRFIDKVKGLFKRKPKKPTEPTDETTPEPTPEPTPETPEAPAPETPKQPTLIKRIGDLFKKKPKPETPEQPVETPETPEIPEQPVETPETPEEPETPETPEEPVEFTPQPKNAPGDGDVVDASQQANVTAGIIPERKPYHERYYLLYGDVNEPESLSPTGTMDYLAALGFAFNALSQARESKNIAKTIEATYKPGRPDIRYCDFCGTEIYGVEYETLADGRDRCLHCSKTAIKTGEEFKAIFEDVRRNMESFYGIRLNVAVRVEMVNSKTLHKRLGERFVPSPKQDGRVLGVAIKDKNGFSLLVENGSPRMASIMTMAHELTHIWQYVNWNARAIRKKYGKKLELEIYEGMAKWVEVQYAYLINEPALAKRTEIITAYRDDAYGHGFLRYRANYPFSMGTVITGPTPFMDPTNPLDEEFCGNITVITPQDDGMGLPEDDTTPTGGKRPPVPTGRIPTEDDAIRGPSARNPDNVPMFAYQQLNDAEKAMYTRLETAIREMEETVDDLPSEMTNEQIHRIMLHIEADHPEFFWYHYNYRYTYNKTTLIVSSVSFSYPLTVEQRDQRQQEIENAIQPFLSSLTDDMSDFEIVQHVYENIISLVDYDTVRLEADQKLTSDEKWDRPDDIRSVYGVFIQKKAVCAGYAKAFQLLLNALGIECTYVTSDTHAWNLVRLEGDYYHIDATWDDSSNTKAEKNMSSRVSYHFFCITTDELLRVKAHQPEDVLNLPVCTATKCNYHHRYGLCFDTFDIDRIRDVVCESIARGLTAFTFKFTSPEAYAEAYRTLATNGQFMDVLRVANLRLDKQVKLRYQCISREDLRVMDFILTD